MSPSATNVASGAAELLPVQPQTPAILIPPSHTCAMRRLRERHAATGSRFRQRHSGAERLTIDQALAIALDRNTSVALAREKIIKSNELINEANAGGLPDSAR